MPFYTALIAMLGAFLFWFVFLRRPTDGNGFRGPGARSGSGAARRMVPRQISSPVALVNDPISATATFLIALAESENQLDAAAEAHIKREITEVMGVTKVDDLYAFSKNAADQVTDPSNLMIRFARIWVELDQAQRQDVYDMAVRMAQLHNGPTESQAVCLRQLAGRLGVSGA